MREKLKHMSEALEAVEKEFEENEQLRKTHKQTIEEELEHNRDSFDELEKLKYDLETKLKEQEMLKEAELEAELKKGQDSLDELEIVNEDVIKYMDQYKDNNDFKTIYQDMIDEKEKIIKDNHKLEEEIEENKGLREEIDKVINEVIEKELKVYEENELLKQEIEKEIEEMEALNKKRIDNVNEILESERDILHENHAELKEEIDLQEEFPEIFNEPLQPETLTSPKKDSLWDKMKKKFQSNKED